MAYLFVNPTTGSDAATGRESAPLQTLTEAVSRQANGTTIILENGVYEEPGQITVTDIHQGQIRARNRGLVELRIDELSGDGSGLLKLVNCEHYCIEGLKIHPPTTVTLADGGPGTATEASLIRVEQGYGNQVSDIVFEPWVIAGRRTYNLFAAVSALATDNVRIRKCDVKGIEAEFNVSVTTAFAGGEIYGILTGGSSAIDVSDATVRNIVGTNSNVAGIITGSLGPANEGHIIYDRCLVEDLSAEWEVGEGAGLFVGMGVSGAANGVSTTIRNSRVFVLAGNHQDENEDPDATGVLISGASDAHLQNVVVSGVVDNDNTEKNPVKRNMDTGISVQLQGLGSVFENITVDNAAAGIVFAPGSDDPQKTKIRNLSLSNITGPGEFDGYGIVAIDNSFVDVDFFNTYKIQTAPFAVLEGPPPPSTDDALLATHITIGPHWTQSNPRYVAGNFEERNFDLEFISPLVNRGGEV